MVSNAKVIIASTEAVKQDGVKYLGVTPEKIHVVMPSVANEYSDQISDEYINEVLSEYKLERGKYLIYIGNRRPHKNLLIAIKAFSVLMKDNMYKGLKFALVGGYDDEKKREGDGLLDLLQNEYPSIKDSIQILGKIPSNKKVAALLNGSIALFHPSLFEGFGLTPLEAIYSNTIAVVSDIPPIREVLGEAGIYVDPLDANNCAKVLETILDNPEARESYLLKADEVKKRMTWDTTSKQLYEALSCI